MGRTQGPGCPGQTEAGARWRPGYLVTLEAQPRLHFLLGTSTSNQATLQGGRSLGSVTSHSHPSGEPPPPSAQEKRRRTDKQEAVLYPVLSTAPTQNSVPPPENRRGRRRERDHPPPLAGDGPRRVWGP